MTEFTVEAGAGNRLSVAWMDGEDRLHFNALIVDGKMGDVLNKFSGQKGGVGTVFRQRAGGGRGSMSYLAASEPPYAAVVEEARTMINALGLAPKAIQARAHRLAETERQRVAAKAKAMREALAEIGSPELTAALVIADGAKLAAAYDVIQNSCA